MGFEGDDQPSRLATVLRRARAPGVGIELAPVQHGAQTQLNAPVPTSLSFSWGLLVGLLPAGISAGKWPPVAFGAAVGLVWVV
jgi:hypothetical protein